MDVIKHRIRTAKHVIHITFDVAVFHQHTADSVCHVAVFRVAGVHKERVLAAN
ncbi:hypothetical protein D3C75_692030 [compost metagenome]